MRQQIETVRTEFTKQAKYFNEYQKVFSKEEYNRFAIEAIGFQKSDVVLEVAAGTCAFGRRIAPYVRQIVELDATEAMLRVGREEGEKGGITNAVYQIGLAEELPFPDGSFDAVVSRLAFHHFERIEAPFAEMCRVLKPGGKLAVIDMEAREERLRDAADDLERLRDPSHVRCIPREEFRELARRNHLEVVFCERKRIPVQAEAWMDVTEVPEEKRAMIRRAMAEDIAGGAKTGLEPYEESGRIMFDHLLLLLVAQK